MNGEAVRQFEERLADYCGARYAICLVNGTATIHTALAAIGIGPGSRVGVPPLTMSATTIAVLQAGATPVFRDVDPDTWLMQPDSSKVAYVPVSLYGLHYPTGSSMGTVDDAAQTLRPHSGCAFTSLSFQASKILALGEGGALLTDDEELATRARSFSSLGYKMDPRTPRIDPATLKHPTFERHHTYPAWNYRMADAVARRGLGYFKPKRVQWVGRKVRLVEHVTAMRREAAFLYRTAVSGCDWIRPQHVPDGWTHDYWCYAVALESAELWEPFTAAVVKHGGEAPFGAWRLTYLEPCFKHLGYDGLCPVAESLQPRLIQGQTNSIASAEQNASAWHRAIVEIGGGR